MFRRSLIPAWVGILVLSGMFLAGQDAWPPPQPCTDLDGDGYGSPASVSCTHPELDCDDTNAEVNPGVSEAVDGDPICQDSVDNDCDGLTDAEDPGCWDCTSPEDCNDGNPCTDNYCLIDGSCLFVVREGACDDGDGCTVADACVQGVCQGIPLDEDGDGFGPGVCGNDCDDTRPLVNPGVVETPYWSSLCQDGMDNDCDGLMDLEDTGCQQCPPSDCDDENPCTIDSCEGYLCVNTSVAEGTPCDDENACTVADACNEEGFCSGVLLDEDGDGFQPASCGADDCDDTNDAVYPGAPELCDDVDNQCAGDAGYGEVDEGCINLSQLPDTGQTLCFSGSGSIPCPLPGLMFYGQDAQYVTNPPSYSVSFDGLTVADNVTGLQWQRCSAGLSGSACSVGTAETRTWEAAVTTCEDLDLAGHTDWRLPHEYELQGIAHYGRANPAIEQIVAFPGTPADRYWSSTAESSGSSSAWYVDFVFGSVSFYVRSSLEYVRCVRGEPLAQSFTENGDGTVTDLVTALMWQQEDDDVARTWQNALMYCENLVLPPGGYSDWRLPDVKELRSIVDSTRRDPSSDPAIFVGTEFSVYWSSTTRSYAPYDGTTAWSVNFSTGGVGNGAKTSPAHVRCVR